MKQRAAAGLPHESTLGTDDFLALTLDVWSIPPESARRVGHPAPFPVELPEQLIRLYTFTGDLVLDPFMGSGSALVAAARLGRRYVGYDLDPEYVALARRRVEALEPAVEPDRRSATAVAEDALTAAGFEIVARKQRVRGTGVAVDLIGRDSSGATWWFDVPGSMTSYRAGLVPSDVVWRALGRAAALRNQGVPLVLLAAELPRSDGDTALRAAGSATVFDVVDIRSEAAVARLARYAADGAAGGPLPGFWTAADLDRALEARARP